MRDDSHVQEQSRDAILRCDIPCLYSLTRVGGVCTLLFMFQEFMQILQVLESSMLPN